MVAISIYFRGFYSLSLLFSGVCRCQDLCVHVLFYAYELHLQGCKFLFTFYSGLLSKRTLEIIRVPDLG